MKTILYSILITVAIAGCSSINTGAKNKKAISGVKNDTVRIATDSLESEVIVIEIGFYGSMATQPH